MKTFIKLIVIFITLFFFISSTFAYTLSNSEKVKLDSIVNKLELSISSRGENYRSIYIERLKDIKDNSSNTRISAYINYILDSLDILSILGNTQDGYGTCESSTEIVNGHIYYLPMTKYSDTFTRDTVSNIGNLYYNYRQSFACQNGFFVRVGSEEYIGTNGQYYNNNNNNYYPYQYQSCGGSYRYYDGYSSYVDYLPNGSSKQIAFYIGHGVHYVTYRCSNGYLSDDSNYTVCDSGYVWNGSTCNYNNYDNSCSSHYEYLNGHNYNVPYQYSGNTVEVFYTYNSNGIYQYKQSFYCSNGATSRVGSETIASCKSGYHLDNGVCVSDQNTVCNAHNQYVNDHNYNVPYQYFGNTVDVFYTYNSDGIYQYKQSFYCSNGATSRAGSETIASCKSGYHLKNGKCVRHHIH